MKRKNPYPKNGVERDSSGTRYFGRKLFRDWRVFAPNENGPVIVRRINDN